MTAQLLYDNRLADAAITASTTATGYDADNVSDWRTNTQWQSGDATDQTLTVNCGSAASADTIGIAGHTLGTTGASIAVECSSDNFSTDTTVAMSSTAVSGDGVIYYQFTSQSKQYWRLKITGLSAACSIAIACIGERFEFPELQVGEYTPAAERVQPGVDLPARGHALELAQQYTELRTRARFEFVTDDWYRDTFRPIWDAHLATCKPFFWVPNYDLDATAYLYRLTPGSVLDASFMPLQKRGFDLDMVGLKL